MIRLEGRFALVTGASRGIGAACATAMAEAGATVAIHYRTDVESAQRVLDRVRAISERGHFSIPGDLTETGAAERLLHAVDRTWGRLDCLVNNAAAWTHNPLEQLDEKELTNIWRLNVEAVFLCAKAAVGMLRRSEDGNIINISSTAGQRGEAFHSPYAASKGAVIAATKSWSIELAPKIRVNAVAPGWVDTDMCTESFADGGEQRIAATIPLGRVATPEDIAGPVLFLASPLARHVTGEILNVNGGSVLAG